MITAGGVHALVRWVPELDERGMWLLDNEKKAKGVLEIKVMSGAELRDISGKHPPSQSSRCASAS